jgi:sensor histidine kinase YesM
MNYQAIGRHLLFWLAYITYILIGEGWEHRDTWYFSLPPEILTDIPVAALIVYFNLYVLMPRYFAHRKYAAYALGLAILLLVGGLIGRFFSWRIWLPLERLQDPGSREPTAYWILARIAKDTADLFPVVAATMVIKLMRNSYQSERKLREMEKARHTAEMGLLKAQINPHFFFNTLNSLYSLTLEGSKMSSEVVLRLSGLMRYMLYETSAGRVLLRDEITHLQNYISIEQMRFADRLELSFQCSGDIEGNVIEPLLLLPFIENAFKHGVENSPAWITIDIKVIGGRLFLKVENSLGGPAKNRPEGLGLGNVKRRLALTYPAAHELAIEQNNDSFKVDLKINLCEKSTVS